jgi:hypothetical protein
VRHRWYFHFHPRLILCLLFKQICVDLGVFLQPQRKGKGRGAALFGGASLLTAGLATSIISLPLTSRQCVDVDRDLLPQTHRAPNQL